MLKLNEIVHSDVLLAARNKALPNPFSPDKVMHEGPIFRHACYTLSGGVYAYPSTNGTEPRLSIHRTAILDDRTACSQNELFRSFRPSLFEPDGILQQFHSQREMVHPPIDPSIQPRRLVVLPRHRIQAQTDYADSTLPGFKAVIKIQNLPDRVLDLFKKFHQAAKSN